MVAEPWCEELWFKLNQKDVEAGAPQARASAGAARQADAPPSVSDMTFGRRPPRFGTERPLKQTIRQEKGLV